MRKSHKQKVADKKRWRTWDRFYKIAATEIEAAIDKEILERITRTLGYENRDPEERDERADCL